MIMWERFWDIVIIRLGMLRYQGFTMLVGLRTQCTSTWEYCDSNLEVAIRQHTCFIRNLEGVDLLTGSRGNNLYTLSLGDMMALDPFVEIPSGESKVHIEVLSVLWGNRLPIPDGLLPLSR
ncbi:hypothetical protein Tco_0616108 [Tanacetum coccineum]